jgi:hypothetical protein
MAELNKKFADAAQDLIYLLDRRYPKPPSIDIAGNRYGLSRTQRMLLYRGVFDSAGAKRRASQRTVIDAVSRSPLFIDGFNVIITLESYLLGLFVFRAMDGFVRDVSGFHRNYRPTGSTARVLDLLLDVIGKRRPKTLILFDRCFDACGECVSLLREKTERTPSSFSILALKNPDETLVKEAEKDPDAVTATSDTEVLDRVRRAVDIPQHVITRIFKKQVPDLASLLKGNVR